jgi:Trans-aconitate methyltransferase
MKTTTNQSGASNNSVLSTLALEQQDTKLIPTAADGGEAKRKTLVGLLRGYFASPVIATLGEMGMADRMMEGEFSVDDWTEIPQPEIVAALFNYLHSIGLLRKGTNGRYTLTPEGRTAIGRNGAFSLLMSYSDYFHQLPNVLSGENTKPTVNRLRNVRGSGQLHGRKFFPAAFNLFPSQTPSALIDIGCGDGCFLDHARQRWPDVAVFGVDLSATAVEATKQRLNPSNPSDLLAVAANGHNVAAWGKAAPEAIRKSPRLVISLWFVAHEFSNGSPERIQAFFSELRQAFPQAQILLGEINKIPSDVLAQDHDLSIMPEFLLFHDLSRQGVLTWSMWQQIRSDIPYTLSAERKFDEIRLASGESTPASFLWLLRPV